MPYERLLVIESRLQTVLQLISTGEYSTSELAEKLGVSVPTISRDVMALRQRGNGIRAERIGMVWHYVLDEPPANENHSPAGRRVQKPR